TNHDERFKIQHALDITQCHVQHQADTRRQRLQEPDMRGRAGQLDMAHALTTHFRQRHFNDVLIAAYAEVLEATVSATHAYISNVRNLSEHIDKAISF